ncbi:MAG TPA: pyruvate formate lyase family protein [Candidatus Lokiarchaeia archaeon]|nr:pyruvate formate lyase family protein [Candidatus Lokiarchaeia archaeon]
MARASKISKLDYNTDEKFTMSDFSHLDEIRNYMVRGKGEFCIERARLITRFLKEKGGLDYAHPFTRQAESLAYILEHKKANIFPRELLAGSSTSKRRGVLYYPEFVSGGGIIPEVLTMETRKNNPYFLSFEEIEEMDRDIVPFWMDKNTGELLRQDVGDDDPSYRMHKELFLYMVSKYNCQSHTIPDYQRVLDKGLLGLIAEARDHVKDASDEQATIYQGMITAMEGVIAYANHLSDEARRQASECTDEAGKAQLEMMAEICRNVPANPPNTFWEAVQSIWTCMNALYQEQANVGFSIGRIDQLLNKFYVHDLEEGKITRKEAIEILAHFWCKVGDNLPLVPEAAEVIFGGTGSNQAITIGGCDKEGNNTVNETTFLCLDVVDIVKVRDPNLNARVREDDPPEYTQRLAEVIISTGATPSLVNDSAVIPALEKTGVSLEDARDYAQVGCLEPNSAGRTFGHTGAILINVMAALELAGGNGDSRHIPDLGPKTGTPETFTTYESFEHAVKEQLKFLIENATKLNNALGKVWQYLHPQPLLTALFEGPMESGKDLMFGGATYNSSGIAFIATADLIDSLYSVKKLVYDQKKLTFAEFLKIVNTNFNNAKGLHSYIVNKLDHFGNGVEEVDAIGKNLIDFLYETSRGIKNYRGGYYNPGYWSMTIHSGFGKVTDAYPEGKLKGEPFASGLTPVSFGQRKGPTGVFKSLTTLDATKMPNGMALNMKFNKSLFKNQEKIEDFKALIKTYFKQGGMQVQFTIHDAKTLIDAKSHPENYPDLMVRISGYTAYFVDLNEHMKDEIINRALMEI